MKKPQVDTNEITSQPAERETSRKSNQQSATQPTYTILFYYVLYVVDLSPFS